MCKQQSVFFFYFYLFFLFFPENLCCPSAYLCCWHLTQEATGKSVRTSDSGRGNIGADYSILICGRAEIEEIRKENDFVAFQYWRSISKDRKLSMFVCSEITLDFYIVFWLGTLIWGFVVNHTNSKLSQAYTPCAWAVFIRFIWCVLGCASKCRRALCSEKAWVMISKGIVGFADKSGRVSCCSHADRYMLNSSIFFLFFWVKSRLSRLTFYVIFAIQIRLSSAATAQ